jgi:hypothetical protein
VARRGSDRGSDAARERRRRLVEEVGPCGAQPRLVQLDEERAALLEADGLEEADAFHERARD